MTDNWANPSGLARWAIPLASAAVAGLVTVAIVLAMSHGRSALRSPAGTRTAATPASSEPAAATVGPCPKVEPLPAGESVAVDWVDFIQWRGRTLGHDFSPSAPHVKATELQRLFTIDCTIDVLVGMNHRLVGSFTDRDASYLSVGTQVYAIAGYDPACRVAVNGSGGIDTYVATQATDGQSSPLPCATMKTG